MFILAQCEEVGLQGCVQCPFKLFKAQSGVFFSSDRSKDGYQRSFILPSRVTFPTFPFSPDTLCTSTPLSLSLMLYTVGRIGHHGHMLEQKQSSEVCIDSDIVMHTWHSLPQLTCKGLCIGYCVQSHFYLHLYFVILYVSDSST